MQANTLKLAKAILTELGANVTDNGEQGTWLVNGTLPYSVRVSVQNAKGTGYNLEAAQVHVSVGVESVLRDFVPHSAQAYFAGNFSTSKPAKQIVKELTKRGFLAQAQAVAVAAIAKKQLADARKVQRDQAHAKAAELLGGKIVGAGHETAYLVFPENFWLRGRAEVKPDAHGMVTLVLTCSPEAAAAAALAAQSIDN